MMPIFRCPSDNFYNLSDFDETIPWGERERFSYRLLRHYAALPKGRNVYKLTDGSYVESEPSDMATVVTTYYGGHDNQITDEEAAQLTSAGYGAYIT